MNTLQEMLNTSLSDIFESGEVKEIVDTHVEKLVCDVVRNATRPYLDFAKDIEQKLAAHLRVDFEQVDFPAYNHLVTQVVHHALRKTLQNDAAEQLAKDLEVMLAGEAPREISFSELVKQLKEWAREDCFEAEGETAVTALIEDARAPHSLRWVSLDPLPGREIHQCRFQLLIREDGTLAAAYLSGKDVEKGLFLGGLYGFERTIFQMYTAKTRLVIDTNEPDIYHPEDC